MRLLEVMLVITSIVLFMSACDSAQSFRASWKEAQDRKGLTTPDEYGDVLIIGGKPQGPLAEGGEAKWVFNVGTAPTSKVLAKIHTNGEKWNGYGKGIHSTRPEGEIEIYINDILVKTVHCEVKGEYDDYWPEKAQAGANTYSTGDIDISSIVNSPTITLTIKAKPYTAVDVNTIELIIPRKK